MFTGSDIGQGINAVIIMAYIGIATVVIGVPVGLGWLIWWLVHHVRVV